jgi:hypothetical protein
MEDLFDLFDLFEVQPEGRLWRGAVNGREMASSKLAELSAKSGKPVFAMNLQSREILEFIYPDKSQDVSHTAIPAETRRRFR